MDLQPQYEAFYQESLRLKAEGRIPEAEIIEAKAARLLDVLREHIAKHPEDPETATFLLFLAEREWGLSGDHPEVQAKMERALAILEHRAEPDGLLIAEALSKLGEFHFLAGRWSEAEPYYRRAIAQYDASGVTQNVSYARCEGGLAQTLLSLGRSSEADAYFLKAIELAEVLFLSTRADRGSSIDKRMLYFLYTYRADALDILNRRIEAQDLRTKANALLPRSNPGEQGFHV